MKPLIKKIDKIKEPVIIQNKYYKDDKHSDKTHREKIIK